LQLTPFAAIMKLDKKRSESSESEGSDSDSIQDQDDSLNGSIMADENEHLYFFGKRLANFRAVGQNSLGCL